MEKMFYTPEIFDFYISAHVFELCDDEKYHEKMIGSKNLLDYYVGIFEEDKKVIQLKYLDKEDIEECGWNFQYTEKGFGARSIFKMPWPENPVHLCQNYKDDLYLSYPIESPTIVTIYNNATYEDYEGVTLTIKNKSELKKSMKQLNINK